MTLLNVAYFNAVYAYIVQRYWLRTSSTFGALIALDSETLAFYYSSLAQLIHCRCIIATKPFILLYGLVYKTEQQKRSDPVLLGNKVIKHAQSGLRVSLSLEACRVHVQCLTHMSLRCTYSAHCFMSTACDKLRFYVILRITKSVFCWMEWMSVS